MALITTLLLYFSFYNIQKLGGIGIFGFCVGLLIFSRRIQKSLEPEKLQEKSFTNCSVDKK